MNKATAGRKAWWTVGLVLVLLYALIPIAWIVSLSLKPASQLSDGAFIPKSVSFTNYKAIFADSQFPAALRNSIGIAILSTLIGVVIATFAAYAIVRLEFPGKKLLMAVALAIAFFPAISIIGPLFSVWRRIGLFDTWAGLIIPYLTFTLPLSIWTLSAFFREVPWDLERAARVDGAGPFRAFWRIIVPLTAPGVFASAILVFIFAWNDFIFAASLTSTNAARTVPVAIAFFTGSSQFELPTGSIAAASVVVTIPVVVLVLLFQRKIVSGLTSGAVKG